MNIFKRKRNNKTIAKIIPMRAIQQIHIMKVI